MPSFGRAWPSRAGKVDIMKPQISIYPVSDSRGITGYGASVIYRHHREDHVEQFYFKGRCPTEAEVLRAFRRRLEGED